MRSLDSAVRDTALYLITGPEATLFGLFTVEPEMIATHTGRKEKAIRDAIDRLVDLGFCRWDIESGWVWVIEMAHYQFQLPLKLADYRCASARKWYKTVLRNPFLSEWWDRYVADFHLGADPHPAERRASYFTAPFTGAWTGASTAPPPGGVDPLSTVQDLKEDLSTSLFGEDLSPLRAREVDLALRPLSRAGVEESFDRIWEAHRHLNGKQKQDARDAWGKLKLTPKLLEQIEAAHLAHVASHDWNKEAGRYCPRLVNWLKKSGWLDHVPDQPPVILSEKNARNVAAAEAASSRPFMDDESDE